MAVLILAGPSAAAGPPPGAVPPGADSAPVLQRARVGEWVTYRLDGGGGRVSYLRLAVTSEQPDASGRPAVWVDLELGLEERLRAPLARISVLAARQEGLTRAGISRLIVGAGSARPQELDPAGFSRWVPAPLLSAPTAPGRAQVVTVERSVSTPAGTVRARCAQTTLGDQVLHSVCTHPGIPLLGLAEVSLPRLGHSLRLQASGVAASRRMPPDAVRPTIGQER